MQRSEMLKYKIASFFFLASTTLSTSIYTNQLQKIAHMRIWDEYQQFYSDGE